MTDWRWRIRRWWRLSSPSGRAEAAAFRVATQRRDEYRPHLRALAEKILACPHADTRPNLEAQRREGWAAATICNDCGVGIRRYEP